MGEVNRWLLVVTLIIGLVAGASTSAVAGKSIGVSKSTKVRIQKSYGKLPLSFIENNGQVDNKVKFYERGKGHTTFFTNEGVYLQLIKNKENKNKRLSPEAKGLSQKDQKPKKQLIKLLPLGANQKPKIIAEDIQKGKVNYFIGNDPKKWQRNISTYKAVRYKEVYKGIDIKYYGNNRQFEYDIIVKPGADPSQVKLSYEGIEDLKVADNGDLEIVLEKGSLTQKKPYVYQEIDGKRITLAGKFKILNSKPEARNTKLVYSFEILSYDKKYPLVIDPILVYSTYLGGNNADSGYDIAVDNSGNAYITGMTKSTDFPTEFPFQEDHPGIYYGDAFVTKIDSSGSTIIYSTYLGGDYGELGKAIAIDTYGNAYIIGETGSSDFPVVNPIQETNAGGADVFVTKIDSSGSFLHFSTYLGGWDADRGEGIVVDALENVYITGYTYSTDFPVTFPSYATRPDAFFAKINSLGSMLLYSTYLRDTYYANDIALDGTKNIYIIGTTNSSDFPVVNPIQETYAGGSDVFVTKIDAASFELSFSTYLGGSSYDSGSSIDVDTNGNIYITGQTSSLDFPIDSSAIQKSFGGGYADAFVAKIDPYESSLYYCTYLGGSDDDYGLGIAKDNFGNAYITGMTESTDFPTTSPIQGTNAGKSDVFVAKIETSGNNFLYSTYLGGNAHDSSRTISVDNSGGAYIVGYTSSIDFPTASPIQESYAGYADAFLVKIGEDCLDADGDGYAIEGGYCGPIDCDDDDPNVFPGSPCDDNLFCTINDVCLDGTCSGETNTCENVDNCTIDECNEDNDSCVHTPIYIFGDFQQPVNQDGSSIFKLGRTIPVKISITDCNGNSIPNALVIIGIYQVSSGDVQGEALEVDASGNANTGNQFRYDAIEDKFIYNLSTKNFSKGQYEVSASLDNQIVSVRFWLK